ncbi:MAG: hypothetical protein MRZ79_02870 [Bacteroidia bacterium]|nr:hypothetical protein [Bacteroidia bacterium]
MKRLIAFPLIFLSLFALSSAQQRIHIDHSCSFVGELTESDIYGFSSGEEAETALKRIMKYTGLPANFTIKAANVPNAAAVVYGTERYILYNQYFMEKVKQSTFTDWSAISILAHEIGHHLSGHTLTNTGSRPDKELEADKFSGFVLYKMGATLQQARVAMEKIGSSNGSSTHPPKSARLAAITNGWLSAKELTGPVKTSKTTTTKTKTGSGNTGSGSTNTGKYYPKKVATTKFQKVWVDHNITKNGEKGMRIHAKFDINYLQQEECKMIAWFYFKSGSVLKDFDKKFYTTSGQVSVHRSFTPKYEKTTFTDLSMFIPYSQLHCTGSGRYDLKFMVGLHHNRKAIGDYSNYVEFWYEN